MPGKRSKHKMFSVSTVPTVSVGWRLGSPKHLFYLEHHKSKNMLICRARVQSFWQPKVPTLIIAPGSKNSSVESKLWMKVKKAGIIVATLATSRLATNNPHNLPDTPNPSVSEFTYRMSRQTGTKPYGKE